MPSSEAPGPPSARTRASDGVLVVGDDPLVSQHLAEQLTDPAGDPACEARWASDFPEAVAAVSQFPPALVVVDQLVDGDDDLADAFLRFLSEMESSAPRVILLRYTASEEGVPGSLDVTVVGGARWFEDLIEAVPARRAD